VDIQRNIIQYPGPVKNDRYIAKTDQSHDTDDNKY
jgi:hypothetical protein